MAKPRSKARTLGKTILGILLGLLVFEIGLQIRSDLDNRLSGLSSSSLKNSTVLLIGDSVMGSMSDPSSLLSRVTLSLRERNPQIEIQTEVRGANSSSLMVQRIERYLEKSPPDIAVIMLGASDLIARDPSASQISRSAMIVNEWLFKSHLFRFLVSLLRPFEIKLIEWSPFYLKSHFGLDKGSFPRFRETKMPMDLLQEDCKTLLQPEWLVAASPSESQLWKAEDCNHKVTNLKDQLRSWIQIAEAYARLGLHEKAEILFKRALDGDTQSVNFLIQRAYFFFGQNKYESAIADFEMAYAKILPNRRGALTLGSCYQEAGQFERGSEFFSKLATRFGQEPNLFTWISESLRLLGDPETVTSFRLTGEDQDYYHSRMVFAKTKARKDESNDLYRRRGQFASMGDGTVDLLSFRKLLSRLNEKKVKILLLQYPHQPDWPALLVKAPFRDRVEFMSLGAIFESHLEQYAAYELFDFDFMHLSELGTRLLAPPISERILATLGERSE